MMKKRMLCSFLLVIFLTMSLMVSSAYCVSATANQTTENESIIQYDRLFIGVGDEYEFELQFEIDYYYITTMNSSIVSVVYEDSVYKIVGESAGSAYILVNYYKLDGTFTSNACQVSVFDDYETLPTDNYYLYSEGKKFLISGHISGLGIYIQTWGSRQDADAIWTITSSGDYYTIQRADADAYLGIDENNQICLCASSTKSPTLWRIYADSDGRPIFVPQEKEHTNLALAIKGDGSLLYLGDYYTDVSTRRWWAVSKTVYLDNYYDTSAMRTIDGAMSNKIRIRIPAANEFATSVFASLNVDILANGNPLYKSGLLADSCPLGHNSACDSTCTTEHKNIYSILEEIRNDIPRSYNHISVLWADRKNQVYTGISNPNGNTLAWTRNALAYRYPVVDFLTITKMNNGTVTNGDEIEAVMSFVLVHELAHIYGINSEPADELDSNGNNIHSIEQGITCIMNYLNVSEMYDYYSSVDKNGLPYFCDDCLAILEDAIPNILHIGN